MLVPSSGVAQHGAGLRWHNHRGAWGMLGNLAVDAVPVVRPVGRVRGERTRLVKQRSHLRGVVDIAGGQRGRGGPPGVGIHADVQLSPGPAGARAVLLGQPLARSAQLQPGAVHQPAHGTGAALWQGHLQCPGPAAQRRAARHRQIQAEQGEDGADHPFGLAHNQAGHSPQCQCRGDRQGRGARLAAARGPQLGLSGRDRRVGEPDREAAALAQGHVVGCRNRYPVPPLRDVVATLSAGFERHDLTPRPVTGNGPAAFYPSQCGLTRATRSLMSATASSPCPGRQAIIPLPDMPDVALLTWLTRQPSTGPPRSHPPRLPSC